MPVVNLSDVETRKLIPGFNVQFVHSDNMTFAYWDVEPEAVLPEHSHEHEQVCHVLEGNFELTIDGQTESMAPGRVAVIPSNAVHSGKALTKCKIMDIFYPIREDYRS